jgi:predicted DNA-binding transcriptional regulator AlpA
LTITVRHFATIQRRDVKNEIGCIAAGFHKGKKMTNLIQQKTTSATNAQPAGTPHQRSSQEGIAQGLARLLRTTEAAIYVGLSPRTMEKHRTYGTGPVYRKLGNRVVYAIEDLEAWAAQGIRRSTSDPGVARSILLSE